MEQQQIRQRPLGQPALRQIQQMSGPHGQQTERGQQWHIPGMHARERHPQQRGKPRPTRFGLREGQALIIRITRLMV